MYIMVTENTYTSLIHRRRVSHDSIESKDQLGVIFIELSIELYMIYLDERGFKLFAVLSIFLW